MNFTLGGKATHQKVNNYHLSDFITLNLSLPVIIIALQVSMLTGPGKFLKYQGLSS